MDVNGSVVVAGNTYGNWSGVNAGSGDWAAVKLDADGAVLWQWQVKEKEGLVRRYTEPIILKQSVFRAFFLMHVFIVI